MGDIKGIAKANLELEELYSGIPDDSVNLTFQDFAEVRQQNAHSSSQKKKSATMDQPITEVSPRKEEVAPITKWPSLDFSRGLEASMQNDHPIHYQNHHLPHIHPFSHGNHHLVTDDTSISSVNHFNHGLDGGGGLHGHRGGHHYVNGQTHGHDQHHHHHASPYSHRGGHDAVSRHGMESMGYDDMSHMSGMSAMASYQEGGVRRRRPGIPHSNICTVCSTYIYMFRHRCLVCGRAYCRQCVGVGMGEMTEGRKCIECLGRRFSQRYIQRAAQVGCCMGYPSIVKQQELKWAEKGPRGSGESRNGRSGMASRSRSSAPRTPTKPHTPGNPISSSFVTSAAYSPYHYPTNHPLPF